MRALCCDETVNEGLASNCDRTQAPVSCFVDEHLPSAAAAIEFDSTQSTLTFYGLSPSLRLPPHSRQAPEVRYVELRLSNRPLHFHRSPAGGSDHFEITTWFDRICHNSRVDSAVPNLERFTLSAKDLSVRR